MMDQLVQELLRDGVSEATVDLASRRGGDTEGHATRYKTYYRLASDAAYGVLLVRDGPDAPRQGPEEYLEQEASNLARLRAAGYDVPESSVVFRVADQLAAVDAAALVVEHIEGLGPYKAITQVRAIRALISHAPQDVGSRYRENWNRLRALSAVMAPRDHQVMLSEDGRIVTIDVEQVGSGRDLPSL